MTLEDLDKIKLGADFVKEIKKKSKNCNSLDGFLDLVFSFRFHDYTIAPTQKRGEIKKLLEILSELKPKNVLEIGTSNGGTLFLICKTIASDATIISIDKPDGPFGGELFPNWKIPLYESFSSKNQNIHFIREDSHDQNTFSKVKNILKGKKFDFILIDGDHSYEGVKKDYEMYSQLVKNNGMIAFHDINPGSKKHVGDVPKFWKEIKNQHTNVEILDFDGTESYGIGLLLNTNEISPEILHLILKELINSKLKIIMIGKNK